MNYLTHQHKCKHIRRIPDSAQAAAVLAVDQIANLGPAAAARYKCSTRSDDCLQKSVREKARGCEFVAVLFLWQQSTGINFFLSCLLLK